MNPVGRVIVEVVAPSLIFLPGDNVATKSGLPAIGILSVITLIFLGRVLTELANNLIILALSLSKTGL